MVTNTVYSDAAEKALDGMAEDILNVVALAREENARQFTTSIPVMDTSVFQRLPFLAGILEPILKRTNLTSPTLLSLWDQLATEVKSFSFRLCSIPGDVWIEVSVVL
jgi:hypothetical protein